MYRVWTSLTWRKAAISAAALLIACGALAVMVDSKREKAIAAAKEYGRVVGLGGRVYSVSLHDREAVDKVLPLLQHVSELRELKIGGVDLTVADIQRIGELKTLTSLWLNACGLRDAEVASLDKLTQLTELHMISNPITDRGLQLLGRMTQLKYVDLSATEIQGEGLKYLAAATDLEELRLTNTRIDDTSIGVCAQLKNLKRLYFSETAITLKGLMELVNLHWLQSIGVPDEIPASDLIRFQEALLKSRRAAREAGENVPDNDNPLFSIPS